MSKKDSQQLEVNVDSKSIVGSTYSNLVGVTVSDVDATLDFVYVNPRIKTEGHVVSRITLPLPVAESLGDSIKDTIKLHNEKKNKK